MNLDVMAGYVVPSDYVRTHFINSKAKKVSLYIHAFPDGGFSGGKGVKSITNSYEKYEYCKNNFDVLTILNKSSFSRKKNLLTKKLMSFEEDAMNILKRKFKKLWDSGLSTVEIEDKLNINCIISNSIKKDLKLPNFNPKHKYGSRNGVGYPIEARVEAFKLRKKGKSFREISRRLNKKHGYTTTATTIRGWRGKKGWCDKIEIPTKDSKGRRFYQPSYGKKYICKRCGKEFKSKFYLDRHSNAKTLRGCKK